METEKTSRADGQTIIINNTETRRTQTKSSTGFILALIGLFLGWIPILGWAVWVLGLIFSILGMREENRGMAIAGLAISLVSLTVAIATLMSLVGAL